MLTVVESPIFQKLWLRHWDEAGEVYLLTLYAKSESEKISLSTLKEISRALEV